jgi:hypothetical protein
MIERYRERYGYLPQTLAADTTYGNGELLQWLDERGIAGYIRVKENPNGQPTDLYGIDQFTYDFDRKLKNFDEICFCPGVGTRRIHHLYQKPK